MITDTAELLKAAKRLLETQGRCREQWINPEGRLCALGALFAAQLKDGEPVGVDELRDAMPFSSERPKGHQQRRMRVAAVTAMGLHDPVHMIEWNDSMTVTDEEVLARFDQGIAAASTQEEPCP